MKNTNAGKFLQRILDCETRDAKFKPGEITEAMLIEYETRSGITPKSTITKATRPKLEWTAEDSKRMLIKNLQILEREKLSAKLKAEYEQTDKQIHNAINLGKPIIQMIETKTNLFI
jgi:hypothetical protein